MPKINITKASAKIRDQELKGSDGTQVIKTGKPTLKLVENGNELGDIPRFLLPKSPEDKQQPSCTGILRAVEFGWEKFHQIAHELPPLFSMHWKELALNQDVIPLAPDWDKYYALDITGVLRVLTARDASGLLVGYVFLMVGPHLHYRETLWGHVDMFWMDPVYRQGWTGVRLFKTLIKDAKTMGVANLTLATKLHFMDNRVGKLLHRLGFAPIETIHAMRLN